MALISFCAFKWAIRRTCTHSKSIYSIFEENSIENKILVHESWVPREPGYFLFRQTRGCEIALGQNPCYPLSARYETTLKRFNVLRLQDKSNFYSSSTKQSFFFKRTPFSALNSNLAMIFPSPTQKFRAANPVAVWMSLHCIRYPLSSRFI